MGERPGTSPRCSTGAALLSLLVCVLATHAGAEGGDGEGVAFFETHVRPLLVESCHACHSDQGDGVEAGLHLDSKAGILRGGDSGPLLVPGKPDESLLLRAVNYQVEDREMPPREKLADAAIEYLRQWIELGAPMPDDGIELASAEGGFDFEAFRREHWAFRPVEKPDLPEVAGDWTRSPIDHFVLDRLQQAGLLPAPAAEARVLLRRAAFTLTGLPPTPEEMHAFLEDESPEAFASAVDRLLASPHYGERWGRHWLDVARYSDGMGGFGDSAPLNDAWRYRDWVLRAFNRDLPYDRFVRDQIVGDLSGQFEDRLATGFFAVGPTYTSDGGDPEATAQAKGETLADRVDTFSRAFLGLTVACARCHDHKFDPITTQDYYALAGIFNNSPKAAIPLAAPAVVQAFDAARAAVKEQETLVNTFLDEAAKTRQVPRKEIEAQLDEQQQAILAELRIELQHRKDGVPSKYPTAHGLKEAGSADMHIALRGDLRKHGALAPRRFLEVLGGAERPHFTEGSGRAGLAEAVVDPGNPLTARVMVNRVWRNHFGRALVRTPSNLGVIGEAPTHPLLLDWLAATFVEGGWSLKALHRKLMLSATWQMSSRYDAQAFALDAGNELLWRSNPRRLDVEAWRDSLLAVTDELDRRVGGPPDEHVLDSRRRTIYGKLSRNFDRSVSEDFLRVFDFPAPRSTSAQRVESIVPQQFLFIMNSPFMLARGEALARRVQREAPDDAARIQRAYALLFQREPSESEHRAGLDFLAQAENPGAGWKQYAQALLGTHEFRHAE